MINEVFILITIAPALLVYMIDYAFGHPGAEKWNASELLSGYSLFIAKITLIKAGAYENLYSQLHNQLLTANSKIEKMRIEKSFKEMIFSTAQPLFTWQKAIGMCPICFHFWVANIFFLLVNIFFLKETIIIFTLHMMISHLIIRLLIKYF